MSHKAAAAAAWAGVQVFDPLLQWAAAELGWRLEVSDSICGITQPPDTVEAARTYLEGEGQPSAAPAPTAAAAAVGLLNTNQTPAVAAPVYAQGWMHGGWRLWSS